MVFGRGVGIAEQAADQDAAGTGRLVEGGKAALAVAAAGHRHGRDRVDGASVEERRLLHRQVRVAWRARHRDPVNLLRALAD